MPDGRGYRWMYLQTGHPGWARYGYPRSCRCMHFPWMPWDYPGFQAPVLSRDEELSALREEAAAMEEELSEIKRGSKNMKIFPQAPQVLEDAHAAAAGLGLILLELEKSAEKLKELLK